ncbi:unnamed protein product [Brassica rapa subsp. narinosa]
MEASHRGVLALPLRGILGVCSPQDCYFPTMWHYRRYPSLFAVSQRVLAVVEAVKLWVGWRHISSWALRLLSLSVKLLRRWGFCPVRFVYMGFWFNRCNGAG